MVRGNRRGRLDYAEVGAMTKAGLPKGHEFPKLMDEARSLQPGERLYFFDKDNASRSLMIDHTGKGLSYRLFNL
jgi:hypothetical protein